MSVRSERAGARPSPPGAVRDLQHAGPRAVRPVPWLADATGSAGLRALRVSGTLAGPALRRVLGEEAGIRRSAFGDRLRRECPRARARVERARTPPPRARRCGSRRRGRPGAAGCVPAPRPRRSGARSGARRHTVALARRRARAALASTRPRRARAQPDAATPARPVARRTQTERSRKRHRVLRDPDSGMHRRRRLHVRCHGGRLCCGRQARGSAEDHRRYSRAGRPLD